MPGDYNSLKNELTRNKFTLAHDSSDLKVQTACHQHNGEGVSFITRREAESQVQKEQVMRKTVELTLEQLILVGTDPVVGV